MSTSSIVNVEFKNLRTFKDDRGFFREIIRDTDPFFLDGFSQWSHSKMAINTVKAWHYHHIQTDWWYVGIGVLEVVLFDLREESPSYKSIMKFKLGDETLDKEAKEAVVRIPPGVLHGCKAITDISHLFYITSEVYNPEDEGRYPFNSPIIPHSWGEDESSLIVAENDKREFIPKNKRTPLF